MCGRTALAVDPAVLSQRFNASPSPGVEIQPRYNIAPSDDLLAIQNGSPDQFHSLHWGFIPLWADEPKSVPNPINARSETVDEKRMFREALEQRRCLIPADGFYE